MSSLTQLPPASQTPVVAQGSSPVTVVITEPMLPQQQAVFAASEPSLGSKSKAQVVLAWWDCWPLSYFKSWFIRLKMFFKQVQEQGVFFMFHSTLTRSVPSKTPKRPSVAATATPNSTMAAGSSEPAQQKEADKLSKKGHFFSQGIFGSSINPYQALQNPAVDSTELDTVLPEDPSQEAEHAWSGLQTTVLGFGAATVSTLAAAVGVGAAVEGAAGLTAAVVASAITATVVGGICWSGYQIGRVFVLVQRKYDQ